MNRPGPCLPGTAAPESPLASEGPASALRRQGPQEELPSHLKGGTGSGDVSLTTPMEPAVQRDLNQSSNIEACCLTHDAATSKSNKASTDQTIFKNSVLGIKGTQYLHRSVPTAVCWAAAECPAG